MAASSLCSPLSSARSSARSRLRSACSVSACECTDTYSPAAIDMAPATRPATPATNTLLRVPCAAATPSTRLAVERMPSFAPKTAARSHPTRPVRCRSRWRNSGILDGASAGGSDPCGAVSLPVRRAAASRSHSPRNTVNARRAAVPERPGGAPGGLASLLDDRHKVAGPLALPRQLRRRIWRGVFVERAPAGVAVRPRAGIGIDRAMAAHDLLDCGEPRFVDPCRHQRAAAADALGVHMRMLPADAGAG